MRSASRSRDYWGVVEPVGLVCALVGAAALLCAAVGATLDWLQPRPGMPAGGIVPLVSAGVIGLGLAAYLRHRDRSHRKRTRGKRPPITRRQATLAVALIWVTSSLLGAIPFVAGTAMSAADGIFESVSGLTTTGATVITDIEGTLPRSLLLWRSLIQWLGGMGIVVLFVAVFPNVGIGARHMMRGEVPGTRSEGLTPRIAETSFTLWRLYAAFTAIELVILMVLGVEPFEAACHALTTMSTGGFSTRNASIAAFDSPAIEYVIATFMFVASVNYSLYFAALRGRNLKAFWANTEFRWYVGASVAAVAVMTLGIRHLHGQSFAESFRYAYFMVATTISSTGYGTDAYMEYPPGILMLVLLMMFVGGSAGSTAGGFKIERMVLLGKQAWYQIKKFYRPNLVQVVRMGRSAVPREVLFDVGAMLSVYATCAVVGIFALTTVEGTSIPTAFGAMLTCLSNMGPAPFHEVADNFAHYSSSMKLFCSVAMLLGRLEFFTLLALFVPAYWRR